MKKSIQNIALLSMLFIFGACEVDKPNSGGDTPEKTTDNSSPTNKGTIDIKESYEQLTLF